MCVAIVGKIIEIKNTKALCRLNGTFQEVSLALLPFAKEGDDVLIHSGFASEIVKDKKKLYKDVISTDSLSRQLLDAIEIESSKLKREIKIVNFSYFHEYSILKYSLEELLPKNIKLLAGLSCPACTIPENEFELGIKIAMKPDVIVAITEDLLHIPSFYGSFSKLKKENGNIEVVNGAFEALELAKLLKKEVVYISIGFEYSMYEITKTILNAKGVDNFSIISSSRSTIPIIEEHLENKSVDGVLCSGYVANTIGLNAFSKLSKKTQTNFVVAGVEPIDILKAVFEILINLNKNSIKTTNIYKDDLNLEKNALTYKYINSVFRLKDSYYRDLTTFKNSRFVLKREFEHFNAQKKFAMEVIDNNISALKKSNCSSILNGKSSRKCPNFSSFCTPLTPQNIYMASTKGICNILYQNEVS